MAGTVWMKLYAISTAKDTDFTCRLLDVDAQGREFLLTQGLIRAKRRKGFFCESPLAPGEPVEYTLE